MTKVTFSELATVIALIVRQKPKLDNVGHYQAVLDCAASVRSEPKVTNSARALNVCFFGSS